jgi:hypothetical protein
MWVCGLMLNGFELNSKSSVSNIQMSAEWAMTFA